MEVGEEGVDLGREGEGVGFGGHFDSYNRVEYSYARYCIVFVGLFVWWFGDLV